MFQSDRMTKNYIRLEIMNKITNLKKYSIYKKYLNDINEGNYSLYLHSDNVVRMYPEEIKEFIVKKNTENKVKEFLEFVDKLNSVQQNNQGEFK
jgi:hypothetical protein